MQLTAKYDEAKDAVEVQVPPTRSDVLHECDIVGKEHRLAPGPIAIPSFSFCQRTLPLLSATTTFLVGSLPLCHLALNSL